MKNFRLINQETEKYAKEKLATYYKKEIIPPEKKEYITDLKILSAIIWVLRTLMDLPHIYLMRPLK